MFQATSTQVIHVKRKRDDAPVDYLNLETKTKRARSLAPQFYFKRLLVPAALDSPPQTASDTSPNNPSPSPPLSILRRDGSQYSSAPRRPLILDTDGTPLILSTEPGEEHGDPYARYQHERLMRSTSERKRVVLQKSGAVPSFSIARDADAAAAGRTTTTAAAAAASGHAATGQNRQAEDGEGMDVDSSEFVYDVFVPTSVPAGRTKARIEGWATSQPASLFLPQGVAGTVQVGEEDTEWIGDYFYEGGVAKEEDEDRVYSDDEDSNAEDYYGADYPEDEDEDYNDGGSESDDYDDDADDDETYS